MILTHRLNPKLLIRTTLISQQTLPITNSIDTKKTFYSSTLINALNHNNKYYFHEQNKKNTQTQKPKFDQKSSYFDILGVSPNATDEQIKSAYLQMVKKYHPDLSKQQNASQMFQLVQKAYEVLSDPQQKSKHRQTINIPNPQVYQSAQNIKQKFKDFKRKDRVSDEWQFSYKLFKKHYENVDAKQKQYTRFVGQGDQYWIHKNQMMPEKKVFVQQAAMIAGSIGIAGVALYYMWN